MQTQTSVESNAQQAVPFFLVQNIEASVRFYVEGLGFRLTNKWVDQGKLRWCWLELGEAAIMLQEFDPDGYQLFFESVTDAPEETQL
jgi:lactoylglutathione lyase